MGSYLPISITQMYYSGEFSQSFSMMQEEIRNKNQSTIFNSGEKKFLSAANNFFSQVTYVLAYIEIFTCVKL